jgi:hypothetical protein
VTTSQKANVRKIEKLIRKTLPLLNHPAVPAEDTRQRGERSRGGRSSSKPRNRSTRRRTARRSGVNGRKKKNKNTSTENPRNRQRRKTARKVTY